MGEIVNLKARRKRVQREAAERAARENRIRHGRTRAERRAEADAEARALKAHDQAKLDR